jgi:thiamine-monophosphate kinase
MESALLAWLRQRLPPHPCLQLGPGDDAALLRLADGPECVVTVDLTSDGVDFRLGETDPRRIGYKALAVNLSDIAAMAARPLAAVIALALPRQNAFELAVELYEGLLPLAERYDVAIAGGDLQSWKGPLVISVTLLGQPAATPILRRSGARPGDKIIVTGALGGSILGRHLDFEPRIHEALLLAERYELHAGMDISDGLSLDLSRLAAESGCGAILDTHIVPIHPDAVRLSTQSGRTPLDHALSDGEDFELLLAVPPRDAERMCRDQPLGVPITCVGEFLAEPGLLQRSAQGEQLPLAPTGYLH